MILVVLMMLGRRWSLSDAQTFDETNIIPMERIAIDVELCGQYMELRRKEVKMRHAITIAEVASLPS